MKVNRGAQFKCVAFCIGANGPAFSKARVNGQIFRIKAHQPLIYLRNNMMTHRFGDTQRIYGFEIFGFVVSEIASVLNAALGSFMLFSFFTSATA